MAIKPPFFPIRLGDMAIKPPSPRAPHPHVWDQSGLTPGVIKILKKSPNRWGWEEWYCGLTIGHIVEELKRRADILR